MTVPARRFIPDPSACARIDRLADEPGRLAALRRYRVLDTPQEAVFDRIAGRVAEVFETPMAAVTLLDETRQWFKASHGLAVAETPRSVAFCDVTIRSEPALAVPDAAADRRFANNPMVTGDPGIRAYLGAPLRTPDGYHVGALCAIDTRPRCFDSRRTEMMSRFAALVMEELERRCAGQPDALTGALSRRDFEREAQRVAASARAAGRPAALLLADPDRFSRFNADRGRAAGDAALRALAGALGGAEPAGRVAATTFGVLVPDADGPAALQVAERLRASAAAAVEGGLALSIGAALLDDGIRDAADWLRAAGAAVSRARAAGGDRCAL